MVNNCCKANSQRGVTLIELLTGMFLFSVLIVSVATFFNFFFDSYYFAYEGNRTIDEVKVLMDRMTKELREAIESEEGSHPLATADDSEIVFYADSDNDGEVERLRYFLEGSAFKRGVIEPGVGIDVYDPAMEDVKIISDYIQNGAVPVFTYYNSDWPADTTNNPLIQTNRLLETQMVGIDLLVNTAPGTREDDVLSTKVTIRNLKSEDW